MRRHPQQNSSINWGALAPQGLSVHHRFACDCLLIMTFSNKKSLIVIDENNNIHKCDSKCNIAL